MHPESVLVTVISGRGDHGLARGWSAVLMVMELGSEVGGSGLNPGGTLGPVPGARLT